MQPQLIETIRFEGGKFHNLAYHQARMNKSQKALFNTQTPIALTTHLRPPQLDAPIVRCRVTYGAQIEQIEYLPYTPKPIEKLKVVRAAIDYPYKFANRSALNALLAAHPDVDEVIIEKEGLLTDTTIANIALFRDGIWYTPHTPLLEGTMRAKLLDEGKLYPAKITTDSLQTYTHLALMNAMIGFRVLNVVIDINNKERVIYDHQPTTDQNL